MKFHRKLWVILITASILLGLTVYTGSSQPAQAQTASQVIVYSAQAGLTGTGDKKSLNLDIVFGLTDQLGNPSSDNPSSADVSLDNGSGATPQKVSYPVSRPQNAMNVEIVVDLSGSMAKIISSWKGPLATFVQGFDQSFQFGFLGFNETVPLPNTDVAPSSNRTDNLATINTKLVVPPGNSGSCTYDALYTGVDRSKADPTKRRAVVLITDGKDAGINKTPCSTHTLDQLTKHAWDPADYVNRTPIFIIGIVNPLSTDLDQPSLKGIATQTSGLFLVATGNPLDVPIGNQFTNVKLALTGQWHIVVPVTGPAGKWKANFAVNLPNSQTLTSNPINFEILPGDASQASTATPTPTMTPEPSIGITGVGLNPDDPSQLLVNVIVTGDSSIASYIAQINDTATNTLVDSQRLNPPLDSPVKLSTLKLKAGSSYTITIQGEDANRKPLAGSNQYGFTYVPPAPVPTLTPTPAPPANLPDTIKANAGLLFAVVGVVAIGLIGLLFVVMRSSRQKSTPEWRSDLTGAGIMMQGPGYGNPQQPYQAPPQQVGGANEFTNPVPLLIRAQAALTVTQSRDKNLTPGQRYDIQDTPFRIGREGPDLMITADDRVSRRHAIIDYGPSGYFVEDQGSTHGTFVNGQKVQGRTTLVDGAEVSIGPGTILTFSIASSARDLDRTNAVPLNPMDR